MSLAPLTRYAGWSAKEVTILNADVKREICTSGMQEGHNCKAIEQHVSRFHCGDI
ncbi:hypothetical protein PG989_000038 [Apiospora arundinis]